MLLSNFGFNQNPNPGKRFQFNPQALNNQANNLFNNLTQGGQSAMDSIQQNLPQAAQFAQQNLPQAAQLAQQNLPQVAQFARSNGADILNAMDQGAVDLRGRIETFRGYPPGRGNQNNRDVSVSQVTNEQGIPQRESQISIRIPNGSQIANPDGFNVQSMIANPLDGSQNLTPMNITRSEINGRSLNLFVDGPVSNGSQISIAEGALTNRRGQPQAARDITLDNPRKFQSPEQAALWGKAFEASNINLFPGTVFPGSQPPQPIPQSTDPSVVRQDLNDHFQRFVDAGKMNPGQMNRMLKIYDNEKYREVFTDPNTGQFEPQLMAAVLGTAGTPGQGTISAIIGGKNDTGRPARVVYGELPPGLLGGASVQPDPADGLDRWFITVNPVLRNEPFQTVSALMAHEAMHQDNIPGQNEEIVARVAEINTWKQQVLVNPELASINTPLARFNNLNLLMFENSGQSFPQGGVFEAPLAQGTQDIVPNSDVINSRSLEDFLRNVAYDDVPNVDTPGNSYLNSFLRQGTRGRWQQSQGFNDNTVARLDNTRFFTPQDNFRLLQILQLQPFFG